MSDVLEFREIMQGQQIFVQFSYEADEKAVALTSAIKGDHDRTGPLVFTLVKQQNKWLISDIDLETSDNAIRYIRQFGKNNPDFRIVSSPTVTLTDNPPIAFDIDRALLINLTDDWPDDYDIAWDNDGGGVLMIKPEGQAKLLGLTGAENMNEAIIMASEKLDELSYSKIRGVFANQSRFSLVQTSQDNCAIVEILDFEPAQANINWRFIGSPGQQSALKLRSLATACIIYSNESAGKYPESIDQLADYLSNTDLDWLKQNIVYLGKNKTASSAPDEVLAYDKTLLKAKNATNVVFVDSHVTFKTIDQTNDLGINTEQKAKAAVEVKTRVISVPISEIDKLRKFFDEHKINDPTEPKPDPKLTNQLTPKQVDAFQELSLANPDSRIMTSSTVLVLNNESGTLEVIEEVPYISGYDDRVDPSQNAKRITEYLNKGVTIIVKPQILNQQQLLIEADISIKNLIALKEKTDHKGRLYHMPKVSSSDLDVTAIIEQNTDKSLLIGGEIIQETNKDTDKLQEKYVFAIMTCKIVADENNIKSGLGRAQFGGRRQKGDDDQEDDSSIGSSAQKSTRGRRRIFGGN
jgi:hypothetical protein